LFGELGGDITERLNCLHRLAHAAQVPIGGWIVTVNEGAWSYNSIWAASSFSVLAYGLPDFPVGTITPADNDIDPTWLQMQKICCYDHRDGRKELKEFTGKGSKVFSVICSVCVPSCMQNLVVPYQFLGKASCSYLVQAEVERNGSGLLSNWPGCSSQPQWLHAVVKVALYSLVALFALSGNQHRSGLLCEWWGFNHISLPDNTFVIPPGRFYEHITTNDKRSHIELHIHRYEHTTYKKKSEFFLYVLS